jgi:serine/threonine-protein kinase
MDRFEANPLPGTEDGFLPFFSPDGRWVGFFTGTDLRKVSVLGGESVVLCEARDPFGADWSAAGEIVFAHGEGTVLSRVSANGGDPERIDSEGWAFWPQFLPPGNQVLLTKPSGPATASPAGLTIGILSLESGRWQRLVAGGTHGRYVPTGHLVYARSGTLLARRIDLDRGVAVGPEVPVLENVRTEVVPGGAQYAISDDGSLAYVAGADVSRGRLIWVSRAGVPVEGVPTIEPPIASADGTAPYGSFRLSADGRQLVATVEGAIGNVWLHDLERATWRRLTTHGDNGYPAWTRDGKEIAFLSRHPDAAGTFVAAADGRSEPERLLAFGDVRFPSSWSPDGRVLALGAVSPETGSDIWVLERGEPDAPRPWLATRLDEWGAAISPDGRWIAYVSDESGRYEVYVEPFSRSAETDRRRISSDGGEEPLWSRAGDEIFYRNGDRLMAVSVSTAPGFRAERPRLLFESAFVNVPGSSYAVSPDGARFLLIEGAPQEVRDRIHLVLNWFEELKAKTATDGG